MPIGTPKPQDLALEFIEAEHRKGALIYLTEAAAFAQYRAGAYDLIPPGDFRKRLFRYLRARYPDLRLSTPFIADLQQQCAWQAGGESDYLAFPGVALTDGVLELGTGNLLSHSEQLLVGWRLPFSSADLAMPTPALDGYLATSLVTEDDPTVPDPQLAALLQEVAGYLLAPGLEEPVSVFLVGDGGNGKGVFANLLQEIIGPDRCTALTIEALTTERFAASRLVGKQLNVCAEEESQFMRTDKFKALVAGDRVSVERKYEQSFDTRPRCKYLFLSNNLPTFSGVGYALERRLKIIPFYRRFIEGQRDHALPAALQAEMPGILRWAVDGYRRWLTNRRVFTASTAAAEAFQRFRVESSSVLAFAQETYRIAQPGEGGVSARECYEAYTDWCRRTGKRAVAEHRFGRELGALWPESKMRSVRVDGLVTSRRPLVPINQPPPSEDALRVMEAFS